MVKKIENITYKYLDKDVNICVEYKNIKNIYFKVNNQKAYITVPKNTTKFRLNQVISEKIDWIYEKLSVSKKRRSIKTSYKDKDIIYLLGQKYIINIYFDDINQVKLIKTDKKIDILFPLKYKDLECSKYQDLVTAKIYKLYIDAANDVIQKIVDDVKRETKLIPAKIAIKNLKGAWGYCSSSKNISININIIMYSQKAIFYTVLHEFCHLKYMNHSIYFWNMVEKYMPEYKETENELRG